MDHAHALEKACDGAEHYLTAPLVRFVKFRADPCGNIAQGLPDDWPFWHHPDDRRAEREMKADPRWKEWVARTQTEDER